MQTLKGNLIISANAIVKAAKMFGSERALAEKIGISRELLHYWKSNKKLLHLDKAIDIYIVTGGEVSIYELRPDLKGKGSIKKFVVMFVKEELKNNRGEVFKQLLAL